VKPANWRLKSILPGPAVTVVFIILIVNVHLLKSKVAAAVPFVTSPIWTGIFEQVYFPLPALKLFLGIVKV